MFFFLKLSQVGLFETTFFEQICISKISGNYITLSFNKKTEGFKWKVQFVKSVISDVSNDHKDRKYAFYHDYNYHAVNYQSVQSKMKEQGGRLADFKTNFTVVQNRGSKTGYRVRGVILIFLLCINNSWLVNWWTIRKYCSHATSHLYFKIGGVNTVCYIR